MATIDTLIVTIRGNANDLWVLLVSEWLAAETQVGLQ